MYTIKNTSYISSVLGRCDGIGRHNGLKIRALLGVAVRVRPALPTNTKDNFFVVSIGIVRKFCSSVCRQISSANDKDLFFGSTASANRLKIYYHPVTQVLPTKKPLQFLTK